MANAKKELEDALLNKSKIKCALLQKGEKYHRDDIVLTIRLMLGYKQKDLETFFKSLDFGYDNGFGGQELFGIVWLQDGTWLSRGEYDGSEWWEYNIVPEIPEELKN